ncbi:MAG: MFS transporter [Clostridia bacterium]|nr:MFS transporter [Clostridia bacterium]
MQIQNTKNAPFGIKDKLGYLFGDFGNDFTFILSSSFLLKFYTDVMHVSAGIVGIVMMLARFIDAFTDVTMGRILDRSRPTRVGKFKPWILRMCAPVAISSFLIYQTAFANYALWFRVLWLFVTYILWGSIFYTTINIPYGAMASSISPEPSDRQSLSTFRSIGSVLAGVIVGAGIPLFAYDSELVDGVEILRLSGTKFTIIAGIFSALAILAYLVCYFLVTERVTVEKIEKHEMPSVTRLISNSLKNRALISIIVASIIMLLSQFTLQQLANYVFPDYYGNTAAQSASTLAMMVGMIVAAGTARPLSSKFGKAEISATSNLIAAVVLVILFLVRPQNVWVYVGFSLFAWLGLGVFTMVSWALITDVIDDAEIRHGIREDGSIYSLYSFSRKLGQAAAAGITGLLLTLIGYNRTDGAGISQSVRDGLFNASTLVPAIGFALLAAVLWFWYPLNKSRVQANVKILRERRGEK